MRSQERMNQVGRSSCLFLLMAITLFALLVALGGSTAGDGPGTGDAGDNSSTAMRLEVGTWTGVVMRNDTIEDTADWFYLEFEGGRSIAVSATLGTNSTTQNEVGFRVEDRDMAQVVNFQFIDIGLPVTFSALTNDEVVDQTYYFAFTWDGPVTPDFLIEYELVLTVDPLGQDDAGTGGDVASSISEAHTVALGEFKGSVGGQDGDWDPDINLDGADVYAITPEIGRFLVITSTVDMVRGDRAGSLTLKLQNATGVVLDQSSIGNVGGTATIRYFPQSTASVFINVTTTTVALNYTITTDTIEPGADNGKRADAGENAEHAMDVEEGTVTGVVMRGDGGADVADFFEFAFEGGRFVEVTLTLRSGTIDASRILFHVLDLHMAEVVNFSFTKLDQVQRFAALTNSEHATLRYYLGVTWTGEAGDFEFHYDLVLSTGIRQNDLGTGKDVTNVTSGAPDLTLDKASTGTVGGSNPQWAKDGNVDGADVFEVQPTARKFLVVRATLTGFHGERRLGFDVRLVDQTGNGLGLESVFSVGEQLELRYYAPTSLPLYALVVSDSEMCNYTITVTVEEPPNVDISVGNVMLTPSTPQAEEIATITVTVRVSSAVLTSTIVRVEVFAGGDKLEHKDVIFDGTTEVVATFSWKIPASSTELTVRVDTLDAIPYETDENNNAYVLLVKIGGNGGDGREDGDEGNLWLWIGIFVGVVVAAIVVAVTFVVMRGQGAEDEGPEDY
jgi:hypothetical protein